jgi:hypothetical protein
MPESPSPCPSIDNFCAPIKKIAPLGFFLLLLPSDFFAESKALIVSSVAHAPPCKELVTVSHKNKNEGSHA